ncbi:MAG: hypothetical protein EOO02_17480 [Chitinophagaceae bacterium]|nr:MAG: hypothetical protein EOO02_17480 [Chitinophagaceae bacterium]
MQANTISEVITILDTIIAGCKQRGSRLGYFATLYKLMTVAVADGISNNLFQDGARMERLDVIFANRYLKAYFDYTSRLPVTASWKIAFDAAERDNLIVVQHLLLGINAHINLDLGIAAADTCNVDNINELKNDFDKINDTISETYGLLQTRFAKISWPAIFLSKIDPDVANNVINFSIAKARNLAWANALMLCHGGQDNRKIIINSTDITVLKVANAIMHPATLKSIGLKTIRFFESKDVRRNIESLS